MGLSHEEGQLFLRALTCWMVTCTRSSGFRSIPLDWGSGHSIMYAFEQDRIAVAPPLQDDGLFFFTDASFQVFEQPVAVSPELDFGHVGHGLGQSIDDVLDLFFVYAVPIPIPPESGAG
jgi:hypothetical protein